VLVVEDHRVVLVETHARITPAPVKKPAGSGADPTDAPVGGRALPPDGTARQLHNPAGSTAGVYDDRTIETEELTLPHPRMHERWFVLKPLTDVAGEMRHPVLGKTVAEMLRTAEEG